MAAIASDSSALPGPLERTIRPSMQLAFPSPMPGASPAVFAVNAEKPHQGVASKNPGLQPGAGVCNSTTALGVSWGLWSGTVPGARVTYEYDAFGNSFTVSGSTPNNYLYRGEQYDSDLGLYYLRARYYNPATGRFTGVDPLTDQGEPRYEYAAADPVDGADPNGTEDLAEYRPLMGGSPPPFPTFHPTWCQGNPMAAYLPACGGGGPPNPPPPPCKCKCFAQLKYRSVPGTGKNHSFWWVQTSAGQHWVIDAGPTGSWPHFGFLNDWAIQGDVGHYPEDNSHAATSFDSGLSCQICSGVDRMLGAAFRYQFQDDNTISYHPIVGPNSNSFARWDGEEGSFYPSSPPEAQAWDTALPVNF